MRQKWGLLLFLGTLTVIIGLFLAIITGEIFYKNAETISVGQQLIQAIVMSAIIVPITYLLYKQIHQDGEDEPSYARSKIPHFFTSFLLAGSLTFISLFILHAFGWITITKWYAPSTWISALLLNMFIAFLYEAFPEELVIRGFIYDVLRIRLSVWKTIIAQAFIFVIFSATITLLLVSVNLSPIEALFALPSQLILHFFFGITLGLVRARTGSLWAAVGFHLGYLALVRFVVMPTEYGAPPILTFEDHIENGVGGFLTIACIIFGSMIILLLFRKANKKR